MGTLGTRTRSEYVRVYDKGIEQRSHRRGWLWRIEAEYKREQARHHWALLQQCESTARYCLSAAYSSLERSGGPLPSLAVDSVRLAAPVAKRDPDLQSALQWLDSQVKPSIQKWIQKGHRDLMEQWWREVSGEG